MMKDIVIVGAGKIGSTIAAMLAETGDYRVTVVDRSAAQLGGLDLPAGVATCELDIAEPGALEAVLSGKFAVLSAAPFHLTTRIAEAASTSGVVGWSVRCARERRCGWCWTSASPALLCAVTVVMRMSG